MFLFWLFLFAWVRKVSEASGQRVWNWSETGLKPVKIFRNSKQWLEPKKLLTLEGSESKTPCAMIKISAWQRLCVYSPEVTGSCLLTSVASTMEPRKVRKLKVLTGFRPVSDQFHTLRPAASKPWHAPAKKRTKRETQRKKERNNTKTRLLSMSKSIVKGKVKEPKASKECLNWIYLRYEKFWDPGAGVPKHCKEGGTSSGTANNDYWPV